jgi:hypothetical protein
MNISLGEYKAKYEKSKIVQVIKISKNRIYFYHDTKRYSYPKEKFLTDFVRQ